MTLLDEPATIFHRFFLSAHFTLSHGNRTPSDKMVQLPMRFAILIFLLLPTLVSSETETDVDEREQLVARLDAIRERFGVPAFAITVVEGGDRAWTRAAGMADLATARPVTAETRFRIGSISKAFAGIALLLAQAQGDLSLSAEVRDLVAERSRRTSPGYARATAPWWLCLQTIWTH